ncbi:hypothetical protein E1263_42245 [Kribbella antibiotica]|uniref:Uncharacterized protein n=1 Tax=Kribbella antibiotica TaxID=190195 RepID=A0A4R4YGH0_9ACTN|nr:hypothetical protein [Kribbella antibiotica]TDD42332.1 hypothetical protein E1263_42245 [Kribbella antibiotica]
MSLYIVKDGERFLWVAAALGDEVYSFVPDLGTFHRNDGLRDDFFMERELQYEQITVTRAKALIESGLQPLDGEVMADHLTDWRSDPAALAPEQVFASVVADLR